MREKLNYSVWFVRPKEKGSSPFIGDCFNAGWQIMAFHTRKDAKAFRKVCGFSTEPPRKAVLQVKP